MSRFRVGVITSHVIQYQDPLFRQLAADESVDLEVLFCSPRGRETYRDYDLGVSLRWDIELLKGYRYRFLSNISPVDHESFFRHINPGIVTAIARSHFDALIVMGWGSVTAWLAFLTCRLFGIPFFISGDASFVDDRPTLRGRLRRRVLEALFARASGFLVMGAMNGDFYRAYGADPSRFFHVPYAIDNSRFVDSSRFSQADRKSLRARFGIDVSKRVLLFSGKLLERKQPSHLLLAFDRMQHRSDAAVVYMGDGIQRPDLEKLARDLALPDVHFLGFINQSEIPRIYAMSDIFVLPSRRDHRGTVVNEAMACGLPVVVSDQVGVWGEGDIVRHGDNGFVFPVGAIDTLAKHLDHLVSDTQLRARMGQRSREIISMWSFDTDVAGIVAALRSLRGSKNASRSPAQVT